MLNFNRQKYISWKGISTNSIVPSNSRPSINGSTDDASDYVSRFGGARPIKHWRKQLFPKENSGGGSAGVRQVLDTPGGSIYLGVKSSDCVECDNSQNVDYIKENIPTTKNNNYNNLNGDPCCNPEANIIKPATTVLNKKYYSDRRAYLESRGKTYNQKLSTSKVSGNTYLAPDGSVLYPNNSNTGPQVFNILDCGDCENGTKPKTIYKPNNRSFAQEGAVSSSTRLAKLKYDTVQKNGASFSTAWGREGANAGKYLPNSNAPYFLKSKNSPCIPNLRNRKNGNKTFCYYSA